MSGIGMIKRVGAGQAGRTPLASRSAPSLRDARRPDGRAAARVAVGSRARHPPAPPPPAKPWVPSYGRGVPGEDTRTRPAHLEKGRGQKPGIRFPRLGSFEVLLHSKWRKPTHLHSAIASLTIPSADDLLASLLAFLGQHSDYGWLRRADRLLLHTAMRNGDEEELTRLLAAAPFLVDATDDGGATALHRAAARGLYVELLLGAGARAGAFDRKGATPMHAAAAGGDTPAHEAAVRALAAAGADPSVADREGRTPLHSAAAAGHAACVAALLGVGAVAGPRDKNSQTAADLALLRGHKRLAGTLIAAAR